jgi:hypothetical protein
MAYATVEKLYQAIRNRLAQPGYAKMYADESAFEADVWARLVKLLGPNAAQHCLTSHTQRKGRSAAAFEAFCKERRGPDVRVLGSNNRRHRREAPAERVGRNRSEVAGQARSYQNAHAGGQAMLALEHHDRTLLMIHCGTVTSDDRRQLQRVADRICLSTKTAIIIVP